MLICMALILLFLITGIFELCFVFFEDLIVVLGFFVKENDEILGYISKKS